MLSQAKKQKFTTNLKIQIFIIHIDVICSIIYRGGNLNKPKNPTIWD